jgi:2-C-methyl-D-erythritol 4-phosphate cytidylyltransferase/2-C-methyl-D-erythritol 2,4-cyclodiphosphate synthase
LPDPTRAVADSTVAVIVVAAGSGTRLSASQPKAFVDLAGTSILERCLSNFGWMSLAQVIIVAPVSHLDEARAAAPGATVVVGGASRQESVAAGLAALDPTVTVVLVHDAARALTPARQFDLVAASVVLSGAGVIPVLPVSDTIKRIASRRVVETVERSDLAHVQTPQGFPRGALVEAYAAVTHEYTDDAALFAAAGGTVTVVDGDALAFKITTPTDLRRAESLLGVGATRTGIGIDVHAYDTTEPLWLGGLYWPDEVGLAGHSDGDAMCHAICDALLSAAGLGDIGGRFGTEDPRFAGAHGDVFIAETVALVRGAGYVVGNVSVQLVAQHPRLGARRLELETHLSKLVGAPVSIAATTTDGLGFTGKGEGVAVIANALLHRAG